MLRGLQQSVVVENKIHVALQNHVYWYKYYGFSQLETDQESIWMLVLRDGGGGGVSEKDDQGIMRRGS